MQRLNIPFDRHKQTTRRKRRVVWMFVSGYLLVALSAWFLSTLWLSRDTVSAAAPDRTNIVIRLTAVKKNAPLYLEFLGNTPLLSGRSLTIRDLLPHIHGEFALFLLEDGSRAVAIRSSEADIPYELFDHFGVVTREVTPNVFLLSAQPLPVAGTAVKKTLSGPSLFPGTRKLGSVSINSPDEPLYGSILLSKKNLSVRFNNMPLSSELPQMLPQNVFAAVSTPALPNTNVLSLSKQIDNFIAPFGAKKTEDISSTVLKNPGYILLSETENKVSFLISTSENLFDEGDQMRFLSTFAALKNPKQQEWLLPDQSSAIELVSDPSTVSVEERIFFGTPVQQVYATKDEQMFTAQKDGQVVITNNEDLLKFWVNPEESVTESPVCPASHALLDVERMQIMSDKFLPYNRTSFLSTISKAVGTIGVESKGKTTTFRLCNL